MLPRVHRMRDGEVFRQVIRRGCKGVQPHLVVHLGAPTTPAEQTSVGFVVSKKVGHAHERNLVKRRLRHLMCERMSTVPAGSMLVVRALPGSASSSSVQLGEELDLAISAAARRIQQ